MAKPKQKSTRAKKGAKAEKGPASPVAAAAGGFSVDVSGHQEAAVPQVSPAIKKTKKGSNENLILTGIESSRKFANEWLEKLTVKDAHGQPGLFYVLNKYIT